MEREEITEIFNTYSENRKTLSEENLTEFLTQEQYELDINDSLSSKIIQKYEPIDEVKNEGKMSFEGFSRYMSSPECLIFKEECKTVYQDMDQPLNDYFISSSHNTYLISDQLVGPSDIWGYVSALVKGCRCLEIDCWDGSQNEPVVYHGYTLTSKLLFKTVIQAIHKYAFMASEYPVVLSLENHCSPGQQEMMADILESTFGDFLLSDMLDDFPDKLPSPEALKFKILVKNKKIGTLLETRERKGTDKEGLVLEKEEDSYEDGDVEALKEPESRDSFLLRVEQEKETEPSKLIVGVVGKKKSRKLKLALALSDLVIYTKAEKFRSFQYSRLYQQFNENNSIGEYRARKLSKLRVHEFIFHTRAFITRIYPKVISGIQLPVNLSSSNILVIVEVYGVPNDHVKQQTRVVKHNTFSPRWNETFTFIIQVPELALVRFVVENQGFLAGNEFLGQYTLPVLCMNKGYRHVPLYSKAGAKLEPSSLFVYVWYIRD
ncbi:1-phosphatidylinositol-4,5-bisphosphate phosphodiesterase zeta-1 [Cricetulus griseus]|nr:1-phosphatidylinositol-4,5-bisphosphate phosphodiesterase zeta-1 [Cricetulus griseus]